MAKALDADDASETGTQADALGTSSALGAKCLNDFVERRDQAAFAELVRIYGRLVFGVCRRVIRNHHDAEDAFQTTFVILSQKADSIRNRMALTSWLYQVAYQVCLRSKAVTSRRKAKEQAMEDSCEPAAAEANIWAELEPILDDELNQLSEKYRAPIVLCDLGGSTLKEAAMELGWPQGTLSTRLIKGRSILAERLTRHGFTLSAGALAVLLGQHTASAAVPTTLAASTVQAACGASVVQAVPAGMASSKVAAVAQGTMKSMMLISSKTLVAALIVFVTAALGLQVSSQSPERPAGVEPPPAAQSFGLPAEIQTALENNARQLSPVMVNYTRQFKSRLSQEETMERLKMSPEKDASLASLLFEKAKSCRVAWQNPNYLVSVQTMKPLMETRARARENRPMTDAMLEWSFDGTAQYRGMRYDDRGEPAHLTKNAIPGARIGELPVYVLAGHPLYSYFNKFSGLTFRQKGDNFTDLEAISELLGLLKNGGTLGAVENVQIEERPMVKIEVVIPNETRRRASDVRLDALASRTTTVRDRDGKDLQLETTSTPEEQQQLVENITWQRTLPETRRVVYYLDPALNYAVRRREEWYGSERLLARCDCSDFEELANRSVWLPRRCEKEIHEYERRIQIMYEGPGFRQQSGEMLSLLFDDSFLTEVVEVTELSGEPLPPELFTLNYTEPGTRIQEAVSRDKNDEQATQNGAKRYQISYDVGQTPLETTQNRNLAQQQERQAAPRGERARGDAADPEVPVKAAQPAIRWFLIANVAAFLLIGAAIAIRRFR